MQRYQTKRELYADILCCALPTTRNALSIFSRKRRFKVLWSRELKYLRSAYLIAEFVHCLYVTLSDDEFTAHDIWFLNVHAKWFIEENNTQTCPSYELYAYFVQQLFYIVPDDLRPQLEWKGPEGDFSPARPKDGMQV